MVQVTFPSKTCESHDPNKMKSPSSLIVAPFFFATEIHSWGDVTFSWWRYSTSNFWYTFSDFQLRSKLCLTNQESKIGWLGTSSLLKIITDNLKKYKKILWSSSTVVITLTKRIDLISKVSNLLFFLSQFLFEGNCYFKPGSGGESWEGLVIHVPSAKLPYELLTNPNKKNGGWDNTFTKLVRFLFVRHWVFKNMYMYI